MGPKLKVEPPFFLSARFYMAGNLKFACQLARPNKRFLRHSNVHWKHAWSPLHSRCGSPLTGFEIRNTSFSLFPTSFMTFSGFLASSWQFPGLFIQNWLIPMLPFRSIYYRSPWYFAPPAFLYELHAHCVALIL